MTIGPKYNYSRMVCRTIDFGNLTARNPAGIGNQGARTGIINDPETIFPAFHGPIADKIFQIYHI